MRDPRQLELDFEGKGQEPTIQEQAAATWAKLERSSVLQYLWGIENGHRWFYDTNPPSTQALQDTLTWVEANPTHPAFQYRDSLIKVLREENK